MAVSRRSMSTDLYTGTTDGKFRSPHPDRGGDVEPTSSMARAPLHHEHFSMSAATQNNADDYPGAEPSGHGVVPHAVRFRETTGRYG